MRLIRRPWKGCQFWDVPFTIPWKGCKFQKWGLRKWGYRIWFFLSFYMLHLLSYDHQGGVPSSSVLTADGARGFAASCDKDYPHKRFKMAQVNHKENILDTVGSDTQKRWARSWNRISWSFIRTITNFWNLLRVWLCQLLTCRNVAKGSQQNFSGKQSSIKTNFLVCVERILACHCHGTLNERVIYMMILEWECKNVLVVTF